MKRTKLIALTIGALAVFAGPMATPSNAAESHPCQVFADPYATVCAIPIKVYCLIFPGQLICH